MKKFILMLCAVLLCVTLFGCGEKKAPDECPFAEIRWTRITEQDVEYLFFSKNGGFSYYCGCGNPVDDADLCEEYEYYADEKSVKLIYLDGTSGCIEKISVVEFDGDSLTLDFDGDVRTFAREETGEEYLPGNILTYEGKTYVYMGFNLDIFYYDMAVGGNYEEYTIYPMEGTQWDMVYRSGDLYVLTSQVEEARAYYMDDANYTWAALIYEMDSEEPVTVELTLTDEERAYVYGMYTLPRDKTLAFDNIEKFATLQKTSLDGFIDADIQLALYDGVWYWRSEVIDENAEGWPEYVYALPISLNEKIGG